MIASSQDLPQYCLPPRLNLLQSYGNLEITPTALIFTNIPNENLALKIHFWGVDAPHYLYIDKILHYEVVVPNTAFKQYLIDTRITKIEVVDSRNYKCIATTYINWLSILRTINDQTVYKMKTNGNDGEYNQISYHLPFYDEEVELSLDLQKFSQKERLQKTNLDKTNGRNKLGQIKVKIRSRINVKTNTQKNIPKQNDSQLRVVGINQSQNIIKKKNVFPASKVNIEVNNRQEQQFTVNQSFATNKSLNQNSNTKHLSLQSASIRENFKDREKRLSKVREQDSQKQFPSSAPQNNMWTRANLDLQLMRVRMQMEDLVGIKEKQKMVTINVKYFESLNKLQNNKAVSFIDVLCQTSSNRYRLYPKQNASQNKVDFDSCLAFQRDAKLSFSVSLKKGQKDKIIKGQLSLNIISQSHQLSLLSSEGILEGLLHIIRVSSSKYQQEKKQTQIKLPLKSKIKDQRKQPFQGDERYKLEKLFVRNNKELERSSKQQTIIVKQLYQSKPKEKQFYLIYLKEKQQDLSMTYKIFTKTIPPSTKLKFMILDEDQVLGKEVTIQARKNNSVIQKVYLVGISQQVPIVSSNLTCLLIRQQFVPSLKLFYLLYTGSLTQINYLVQQLSNQQFQHKMYQPRIIKQHRPITQKDEYQIEPKEREIKIQNRQRGNQMRKLKTQELNGEDYRKREEQRRITTEGRVSGAQSLTAGDLMTHQQENQLNPSEHAQNQNIYLVDLMTRFLQSLSIGKLQSLNDIKVTQLVELALKEDGILQKDSAFRNQKELVEIVLSIFLEQADSAIDLPALKQSYQAYKTFKQLYIGEIQKLMVAIKKEEPTAADKIRSRSQLGMINQRILWNRALSKVSKFSVRERVSKFYRISHYGPTDAHFLIQDLQSKSKTELKQLDISNLGILIRESVEKYLSNVQTVASQIITSTLSQTAFDQNWINIRGLDALFESLFQLKISLWESLMLIEEIKVCYGCDLQADQGIISVDSITEWITTVQNRPPNEQQKSQISLKENIVINYQRQNDQKSRDNQSLMRNDNNDSQIYDIANLLRKREEELYMYEKPQNVPNLKQSVISKNVSKNNSMVKKKKDAVLLGQFSQDNVSEEQIPVNVPNTVSKIKIVGIKINQIKLYQQSKSIEKVKIEMGVQSNSPIVTQNCYLYLSHFDPLKGHTMNLNVDCADRPTIWLKILEEGDLKGKSGVVWEEYCGCFDKATVRKTMIIYNTPGTIIGKVIVQFVEQQQMANIQKHKQQRQMCQASIQLLKPIGNDNESTLFVRVKDQIQEKQLLISQSVLLDIKEPVYYRVLQIENAGKQYGCQIPLEQLFLRRQITATYPLITYLNCTFVGNINLALKLLPQVQSPFPAQHIDYQQQTQILTAKKTNEQQLQSRQINAKIQKIEAMIKNRDKVAPPIDKIPARSRQEKGQVIKRIDNIYKELKAKYSR